MPAYYNEIDPYAAQWLRNLIAAGHIASGDVDTRSIEDVKPDDLRGYTQCHFFAGVGVWSYALRCAGWTDDKAVWTGSCPCQPFSSAGKRAGFDDERHLWPAWQHLISECRPPVIIGEQVASKNSEPWLDLVHTDLEALDYAFGAIPFPAASVGAPHMRDRLYFVADHAGYRRARQGAQWQAQKGRQTRPELIRQLQAGFERCGSAGDLENNGQLGLAPLRQHNAEHDGRLVATTDQTEQLADHASQRCGKTRAAQSKSEQRLTDGGATSWANATQGFWADADWLFCKDGKWRPVEPGAFPLADGAASRVGRLRAYGNAIVAPQAQTFIECVMEAIA